MSHRPLAVTSYARPPAALPAWRGFVRPRRRRVNHRVWLVLVHFRLTVPPDLSERVQQELREREWTTNVTVLVGAGVEPAGDLIECDVARERAGVLLNRLDEIGVDERGGIVVLQPLSTPFAAADRIERLAPG